MSDGHAVAIVGRLTEAHDAAIVRLLGAAKDLRPLVLGQRTTPQPYDTGASPSAGAARSEVMSSRAEWMFSLA